MPIFADDIALDERIEDKIEEPPEYRVILLNDNYTTRDFVVQVLIDIFHKSEEEAMRLMLDVHRKGRGTAGVYTYDIAVTKVEEVHIAARMNDFPLLCIVEEA